MWEGTDTHTLPPKECTAYNRNLAQGKRALRLPGLPEVPAAGLPLAFFPPSVQKEARKVPVGGTRINPAAGLDKLESFSAWQREHETNGSESEK